MTENYFNYFTEIEEHFIRRRARNLLISPLDWCLVELWKENGVPLHIALRGIDRSFDSAEKRRKSTPKSLFYCHPAVMEAFEEYRDATLGKGEDGEEDPAGEDFKSEDVAAFIVELLRRLESRKEEASKRARERLVQVLEEIQVSSSLDFEEIDRSLDTIGRDLLDELSEELKPDELKLLKKEARGELRRYRKRISKEMYARLEERHIEGKLRERFDLPAFSLLRLESPGSA